MEPTPDPRQEVLDAARLARLPLTEDQLARLAPQLATILDAFSALAEAPVDGLEPLITPHVDEAPLRADEVSQSVDPRVLLERAPRVEDGHYKVPRAIEDAGAGS